MDNNENQEMTNQAPMRPASSEPSFQSNQTMEIPTEYKPISMWGYFGYQILFAIPCVGFILLCVFSFGGTSNINLKNFARSYFCVLILGLIITAIFVAIVGVAGFGAAVGSGGYDASSYVSPY